MRRSLSSLYLVLSSVSLLCTGSQMDPGGQQRCVLSNNTTDTDFVELCRPYYNPESGYFSSGSEISGLRMALPSINDLFQDDRNLNPCVDLMLNYLCLYYFPSCDLTTEEITPVCDSSCALIANNENCSELREIANGQLKRYNVTPSSDCRQTYSIYVNPPAVSENCLSIIGDNLNETLPIRCIKIPEGETCLSLIPYTHYAPNTFEFTEELSNELNQLINEFEPFDRCRTIVTEVICVYRYPACSNITGRLLPICTYICQGIESVIVDCSLESFGYPTVSQIVNSFDCLDPQTYFTDFPDDYIEDDPSECSLPVQNFTDVTSAPIPTEDDDNTVTVAIIIGSVLGACAVVIIAIIITLFITRKVANKLKTRLKCSDEHTGPPSTVRYRAHNDSHLTLVLNYPSDANSPYLASRRRFLTEESVKRSKSSLLLEASQFLEYVRDKFYDILLPVESITKQSLLGKGAFGVVHKGEMVASDGIVKAVAIKTIKSSSLDAMKDLVAESAIMKTFHHPNVLPLLGVCIDYDDEDVLKIVIPFMANGDLRTFLKDSRVSPDNTQEYPETLSEEILLKMCFDIAKGMEYLAGKRFIHRDLAARNCMVDALLSIKIADFGLAKDVYSTEYYRVDKHTRLPAKWMSLESLLDGYFDEKTDVWSYGVTCWEIFSLGRIPYPGVDNVDVINLLKSGTRLERPELCSSEMNEVIKSTWIQNPTKRPTFAMIVQNLSSMCNFTDELNPQVAEDSTTHAEDAAESNGYISVLPK